MLVIFRFLMKLLHILLVLCLALSQTPDSDGIIELDSKTFHKVIKSDGNLLLFFHSPVQLDLDNHVVGKSI